MDSTIRDLAGLRGSYRIVDKTVRAVELLLARLEALEVKEALFYLDQQVSNSGAFSPAWRTWSPPMPSSWTSAAAGTT